jgi:hypothetical protein
MRPRCTKRKGFYNLSHANFAGLAVAQQFQDVKNLQYFPMPCGVSDDGPTEQPANA